MTLLLLLIAITCQADSISKESALQNAYNLKKAGMYDKAIKIAKEYPNDNFARVIIADSHVKKKQYKDAAVWFTKAANNGHAYAMTVLGEMHYKGLGVSKNKDIAMKYYLKAADKEDPVAQNMLGEIYYHDFGGIDHKKLGALYWSKAARQGLTVAQNNICRYVPMLAINSGFYCD